MKRLSIIFLSFFISLSALASSAWGPCTVTILQDLVGEVRHSREVPRQLRDGLISNLEESVPIVDRPVRRWSDENLARHHNKHKNEFPGDITRGEYARRAREFGDGRQEHAIVFDALENGRRVKLDLATREVLVTSTTGVPITYFRAELNYRGRELRSMGELALFLHHGEASFREVVDQYRYGR